MDKINFQNKGQPAINDENLNKMQEDIENAIEERATKDVATEERDGLMSKEDKIKLDNIYPVGSIYISTNNNNPSNYFGGTWEQIKDRFLLSAGDTYEAGEVGGSEEHNHGTDNLTANIMNYGGSLRLQKKSSNSSWISDTKLGINSEEDATQALQYGAKISGKTDNSSNMPPYIVVYIWKRTD
jgi:hypothetical protein